MYMGIESKRGKKKNTHFSYDIFVYGFRILFIRLTLFLLHTGLRNQEPLAQHIYCMNYDGVHKIR